MKNLKHIKSNNIILNNTFLKRLGYVILLCSTFFLSCESFVEVDLPNDRINGETVFEDLGTATAALTTIYARMRDENYFVSGDGFGITSRFGLYADEMDNYNVSLTTDTQFNSNTIFATDNFIAEYWNNYYSLIYAANAALEGLNDSASISETEKEQLIGEALFIRAFVHFYLVNLFGDIPYIKTTNFEENTIASKITVTNVYNEIIIDLLEAKSLLSDAYVTSERTRPNKGVASALLSRVYLYSGDYNSAETESTLILNNVGLYSWESDLNKVFLKESTSTIWHLKPKNSGSNTYEAFSFIFESGPPPSIALTTTLVNAFEPGDNRLSNWVGVVTDGVDTWHHAFKYKEKGNAGSVEYSILFRLAEQYLIRAEARAQQNDVPGAQQDLNIIRTRAGLGNTTASTLSDLLDAILQERRIELFVEQGHRWFDLKRMGESDAVLSQIITKTGWESTDVLLPIPEVELIINENLEPQNPGY